MEIELYMLLMIHLATIGRLTV